MFKRSAIFLAAALLATAASADLKGNYQLQKGNHLDLTYHDDKHMRANIDDDRQLLVKGDEIWMLKRQDEKKWIGINTTAWGGLLQAVKGQTEENIGPVQLRSLGRKETVAGYQGEVFELSSGDKKYEVVLSDNPDVLALTNAWRLMAQNIAQKLGQKEAQRLQQALDNIPREGKGGLLRQGDNLTLVSIDKNVKGDIDLPPDTKVMDIPKFARPH